MAVSVWPDDTDPLAEMFDDAIALGPPEPRDVTRRPPVSLKAFLVAGWHVLEPGTPYLDNWHVDAICTHLEAIADGRIRRLIVNIPPGHMKSLIVSVFWPAWMWTFWPEWRGLFGSYAIDLALRDSVRTRDLIESEWYQETFRPDWRLATDQNVKSYFANSRKGFRLALSVGSKATGFRGNCTVVDDPLNVKDQHSALKRQTATDWWDKSMSSRLNDQRTGARLVIMQRLHTEDLSGHLIARGTGPNGYDVLRLPSEFEPKEAAATSIGWRDPRTEPGELLFPELFPREVLAEARIDLGSDGYAGQHQQRPVSAEGSIFKRQWWRYYTTRAHPIPGVPLIPDVLQGQLQSWDMAFKGASDSDFVSGQVWGWSGADSYLLARKRERAEFTRTLAMVEEMSAQWPQATAKLVEDKANGPAVISMLRSRVHGLIPVEPEGGKEARAWAVSPMIEAGNVWLPHPGIAPWIEEYVDELASFPKGANDDDVDATTQALRRIQRTASARDLGHLKLGAPVGGTAGMQRRF